MPPHTVIFVAIMEEWGVNEYENGTSISALVRTNAKCYLVLSGIRG